MINRKQTLLGLAVAGLMLSGGVQATTVSATYDFYCITSNSSSTPSACDLGEASARMDVSAASMSADLVTFTFTNINANSGSIADIYFYDGALLGSTASISSSSGVSFSFDAKPKKLPGANGLLETQVYTSGDSDAPVSHNGVDNPGEWVAFTFTLQSGLTYADVIADLAADGPDPDNTIDLVVGLHMQAFPDGESESLLNNPAALVPPTVIPVPAAVWLFGSGLIGLLGLARRR